MEIKRDKNGFAITTILFGMLILFMLLLVSSLSIMSSNLKNRQKLVNNELGSSGKNIAKMLPNREYANYNALKSAVNKDNKKAVSWLYCFSDNNECRYISLNELLGIGEKVYFSKTYNSSSIDKSLTINYSGYYYIEACGASGGNASTDKTVYVRGGKGACTEGYVKLSAGDNLFFNIGTKGESNNGYGVVYGGFSNGGDAGGPNNKLDKAKPVGSGGGSTDISVGYNYYDSGDDEIKNEITDYGMINYLGPDVSLSKGYYQIDVYGNNVNNCYYAADYNEYKYNLSILNNQNPSHITLFADLSYVDLDSFILHAYQYNYTNSSTVKCEIKRESITKITDRIVAAAGGGGASYNNDKDYGLGGIGGDLVGGDGGKMQNTYIGVGGNQRYGAFNDYRFFYAGITTYGAGGGGGYYGGTSSYLYSGGGGGSSFLSGYAGVNAENVLTKNNMKKNSMYVSGADTLLMNIAGRNYLKKNSGFAILGYYYTNDYYTGPILVGTTPESVAFYAPNVNECTNITASSNTIKYNNVTYYYSNPGCFIYGNHGVWGFEKLTSNDAASAAREILDSYHYSMTLHSSGKYFINSSIIPGKNSGDGYVNISYVGMNEPERTDILKNVRYVKECISGFYTIDEKKSKVYNNSNKEWTEFQIIKDGINLVNNYPYNLFTTVPNAYDNQVISSFDYKVDSKVSDGFIDNNLRYNLDNVRYLSPSNKKINEAHCLIYDIGVATDIDEIAVWHNYLNGGNYEYDRLSVSSDGINWKEISFDEKFETSNGKRVNAWEKVSNVEEKHYSKVTYDYNVNKKIIQKEYYDTDYVVDWDYDFEIETTINIPTLGQSYLIFSSYEASAPFLAVSIENNNSIMVNINGYVQGGVDNSNYNTVFADEDIKVLFKWDSVRDTWTLTAKGEKTNIKLSNSRVLNGKILKSLRFGNADHRANPQYTYKYPITVKSFKISTMYISDSEIVSRPLEIVHFEGNESKKANGMIADETYILDQVKATPETDTVFIANWGKKISLVNMTFDFNVDTKSVQNQYIDTGYTLNWDADFEIETKINIASLNKNYYLVFSSWSNDGKLPFISLTIDGYNRLISNVNNSILTSDINSIHNNEDILVNFKWDSLHASYVLTANGKKTKIKLKGKIDLNSNSLVGRDAHTLRFGNVDNSTYQNQYNYPIKIKSFKIKATYVSNLKFANKPDNIIRYEDGESIKATGLYTSSNEKLLNDAAVPEKDTTYIAKWNKGYELVNITYDYNVNKKSVFKEYYDTGFVIDWNKDFKIETTINVATLGQNYLLFSSYGANNPSLLVNVYNNNYIYIYFNGGYNNVSGSPIFANEDIKIVFRWDSFKMKYTFTAKGEKTNITIENEIYKFDKDKDTLRFGNADYTPDYSNSYTYPITIKSFKITSQYVKNYTFNKVKNVVHFEEGKSVNPTGLYTSNNVSLASISNVPNQDTTYVAKWNTDYKKVNITYNYDINKTYNKKEYLDSGYIIDWNKDFEIEATVNVATLGQNYLLFSSYGANNPSLLVNVYNNNYVYIYFNGGFNKISGSPIFANEDIKVVFKWDSFKMKYTFTAKGEKTNISIQNAIYRFDKDKDSIRIGNADYTPDYANPYMHPITIKSFKIKTVYLNGYNLSNQPVATDSGYITRNWKKADNSLLNNGEIISGDAIYNSNWVPNDFTLTLNSNGGVLPHEDGFTNNENDTLATKSVTYDSPYGNLLVPTRDGYTFDGWYTEIYNGSLITSNTIVSQSNNHVLYARWK